MIKFNKIKMARDDRIQMPMSGGGIVRYFEDEKSKFEIKPSTVVVMGVVLLLLVIFLHLYGHKIFGL